MVHAVEHGGTGVAVELGGTGVVVVRGGTGGGCTSTLTILGFIMAGVSAWLGGGELGGVDWSSSSTSSKRAPLLVCRFNLYK